MPRIEGTATAPQDVEKVLLVGAQSAVQGVRAMVLQLGGEHRGRALGAVRSRRDAVSVEERRGLGDERPRVAEGLRVLDDQDGKPLDRGERLADVPLPEREPQGERKAV